MRKLLSVAVLLAAVGCFATVASASAPLPQVAPQDGAVTRPVVYVSDLSLSESTVAPGAVVKGTLSLSNEGSAASPETYYRIKLMGDYSGTLARSVYAESALQGPVSLAVGEKKKVSFAFALPSGIAGKGFGIQAEAVLKNGVRMGWADSPIAITGSSDLAHVSGSIKVGDATYSAGSGPTVKENETAVLALSVDNGAAAGSFVPSIEVYLNETTGQPVKTVAGDAISLSASQRKTVSIELPKPGKPGVYAGIAKLVDSSNALRSNLVKFRYIVAGDIANIKSLSAAPEYVRSGDIVRVAVVFTGTPDDIASGLAQTSTADLAVTLTDKTGAVVGTGTATVKLSAAGEQAMVNVKADKAAGFLYAKATISKGGKALATLDAPVSTKDYSDQIKAETPWIIVLATIVLAVILVILIIMIIRKRALSRNIPLAILLVGLVSASSIVLWSRVSSANEVRYPSPSGATFTTPSNVLFAGSACESCDTFKIFVNSLIPSNANNQVYAGRPFVLNGSWEYYACSNTIPNPKIIYTPQGGSTVTLAFSAGTGVNQFSFTEGDGYSQYQLDPITFTTAGTSTINITYTTDRDDYNVDDTSAKCKKHKNTSGNEDWPNRYDCKINATVTKLCKKSTAGEVDSPRFGKWYLCVGNVANTFDYEFQDTAAKCSANSDGTSTCAGYRANSCRDARDWQHPYYYMCDAHQTLTGTISLKVVLPPGPTGVAATAASCGAAKTTVTWNAVTGATGYNVYRSQTQNGTYVKANGSPLTSLAYDDTGVTSGSTYYYRVTAIVNGVESDKSAASNSIVAPSPCSLGVSLRAVENSSTNGSLEDVDLIATITSGTANGNTTFKFYCSSTNDQTIPSGAANLTTGSLASTSYTAVDLCDYGEGSHYAKVVATRGGVTAVGVAAITVTKPTPTVVPTVDLKVNDSDGPISVTRGTSANLTWTSADASTCTAGGNWSGSKAVSNGSETTGALDIVQAYTYTLTCTNSTHNTSASDSVTVNVGNTPASPKCGAFDPQTGAALSGSTSFQVVGKPVLWKITENARTDATYTWSGTNFPARSGLGLTQVVKTYTVPGYKSMNVSDGTNTVQCNAPTMLLIKPDIDIDPV